MKYKAIIETDEFEDFEFFEDGNGKYIHGIDAGSVNGEWIALYFTKCKQESILDKIRAEILEEKECAYADFEQYKVEYLGQDWEDALDSLPQDDFRYGMERCIDIIDKYRAESEVRNDIQRK